MVHIGMPSYYRKLGEHIMGRQDDDFTVHYEEVGLADEPSDKLSKPETTLKNIKRRMLEAKSNSVGDGYALVVDRSSYTIQDYSGLFHRANSENHDINEVDFVEQSSLLILARGLVSALRFRRKLEKASRKGTDTMDEFVFEIIEKNVEEAMRGKQRNKRRDKVIIRARNQIALDGVDATLTNDPSAKLVLIWGVGHRAGLQAGLIDRGYEHTDSQETELAVNLPQLKRTIKKNNVALERQQEKVDRYQALSTRFMGSSSIHSPSGTHYRNQSLRQIQKDKLARENETQELLDQNQQRSTELMKRIDKERLQRDRRVFGTALVDDKKQDRRHLPWFSKK
ncbi:hypothetical protein KA068_00655 [Candidatus Saccharibacteria bacterium]|nr:hypothetical protein [Candidatus Saccharibacteria bacterium]